MFFENTKNAQLVHPLLVRLVCVCTCVWWKLTREQGAGKENGEGEKRCLVREQEIKCYGKVRKGCWSVTKWGRVALIVPSGERTCKQGVGEWEKSRGSANRLCCTFTPGDRTLKRNKGDRALVSVSLTQIWNTQTSMFPQNQTGLYRILFIKKEFLHYILQEESHTLWHAFALVQWFLCACIIVTISQRQQKTKTVTILL